MNLCTLRSKAISFGLPVSGCAWVIACLLFSCSDGSKENKEAARADTLVYEQITLTKSYRECPPDSDKCTRILLSFPKFNGVNGDLADSLAGLQSRLLENEDTHVTDPQLVLDFFIRHFEQEVKLRGAGVPSWNMEKRLTVVKQNPSWICLKQRVFGYEGGAHDFEDVRFHTLQRATGKHLYLRDFFDSTGIHKLTQLGEAAFCQQRDIASDQSFSDAGFTFPDNRFALPENFCFDANGITFYFNEYEVGPYSMGETVFTIPANKIVSLMKVKKTGA